jgi:hypothetical protein
MPALGGNSFQVAIKKIAQASHRRRLKAAATNNSF